MTDGNVQKNSLTKEMKVKLKMEKNLRNSCKNFPEGFEKKDFPYSINNNEDSSKKQLKSFQLAHSMFFKLINICLKL